MAELGAIASIIGIVGIGAKLSISLFELAATVGSAGTEIRAIGTEISLFCSVLRQLEKTLNRAKSFRYSISAIETTQEILDKCQDVFREIEIIIDGLRQQKSQSAESSVDFVARLKWTFRRSKVQMHRTTLESCKLTLHLMLTTLDFAQKVADRRISTIKTLHEDEQEQTMTQSLIIAQQCAIDKLEELENEEAEQFDTSSRTMEAPAISEDNLARLSLSRNARRKANRVSHTLDGSAIKVVGGDCAACHKRFSMLLNELVPHPRRHTWGGDPPSFSRSEELSLLLRKWTDQWDHWNSLNEAIKDRSPDTSRSNLNSQLGSSLVPEVDAYPRRSELSDTTDSSLPEMQWHGSMNFDNFGQEIAQRRSIQTEPLASETPISPRSHSSSVLPLIENYTPHEYLPPYELDPRSSPLIPEARSQKKTINTSIHKTLQEALNTAGIDTNKLYQNVRPLIQDRTSHLLSPSPMPENLSSTAVSKPSTMLKITIDDQTETVILSGLRKHNIRGDWRQYVLSIVYDDTERCLSLEEKPRQVFESLKQRGKKPVFKLKKISTVTGQRQAQHNYQADEAVCLAEPTITSTAEHIRQKEDKYSKDKRCKPLQIRKWTEMAESSDDLGPIENSTSTISESATELEVADISSVAATCGFSAPTIVPGVRLDEDVLRVVQNRDPQENVREYLNFQYLL